MKKPLLERLASGLSVLVASALVPTRALADEPYKVTEPSVMKESTEITSVVDAFDGNDSFDLNLTLGFQQTWKSGNIVRESASGADQFSSGGYTANNLNVGRFSDTTSRLNTQADIGLYKDVALVARLPIILSNDRSIDAPGAQGSQSIALQGANPGEQLFRIPFKSPTRSGIEYLALGLDFALMNQFRDPSKPTWRTGFEGRFNVSEPMHACNPNTAGLNQPGPQVQCADPSDINRNGVAGEFKYTRADGTQGNLDGTQFSGSRKPGVSRGTTGLEFHTYLSKRIKYIEPYGGFQTIFEFQNKSSDFGLTDLQGSLVNHPPLQGSIVAGISWIPWEVRDNFQRIVFDGRFQGTYRSEGRDYSPLFDALGSSDARSLRDPKFAGFKANPDGSLVSPGDFTTHAWSVVDENTQQVYTTGITDVQQHGIYTFTGQVTFQAAEQIKFNVGAAYTVEQARIITFDQPCNPDLKNKDAMVALGQAGPCKSGGGFGQYPTATGVPNPNYRPTVNVPGRRFLVDDVSGLDVWLNATVMF